MPTVQFKQWSNIGGATLQHLCTFNIVAPLITFCQMFGRRRKPSARPSLSIARIDRPIAQRSSSLVLYRVPSSSSFTLVKSIPVVQRLSYSPLDPRFAGSITAGVDGFFQSVKIVSITSFGREVKPCVPCRRFTARKRTSSRN